MKRLKVSPAGFTIIEVALVVLVGGLVIAALATMLNNYLQELKVSTTQSRMRDIDEAIIQYLNLNGALPCTASLTDAQDSTTFGRQLTSPPYTPVPNITYVPPVASDCYASVANAPTGAFGATGVIPPLIINPNSPPDPTPLASPGYVVIGAVPVRDINLPDRDIADAWGNRFVYAVSDVLTVNGGYYPTQGSVAVLDGSGNDITLPKGSGQYVVVSLGADGAGAYTIDGIKNSSACPAAGSSPEALNCNYPTAKFRLTMQNTKSGAGMFDDYITFHAQQNSSSMNTVPPGMITSFTLTQCPPGWVGYTGDACTQPPTTGNYVCCQKF